MRILIILLFISITTFVSCGPTYSIDKEQKSFKNNLSSIEQGYLPFLKHNSPPEFLLKRIGFTKKDIENSIDSLKNNSKIDYLNAIDIVNYNIQFIEKSDFFVVDDLILRFIKIKSEILYELDYSISIDAITNFIRTGNSSIEKKDNTLLIEDKSMLLAIYNPNLKNWFHMDFSAITGTTLLGKKSMKQIVEYYYNNIFQPSATPWSTQHKKDFLNLMNEVKNNETYQNINFDKFCNCKIMNYEKVPNNLFTSDSFHESNWAYEIISQCFLISEE